MTHPAMTDEQIERGKAMKALGRTWQEIADAFGISVYQARYYLKPGVRERDRQRKEKIRRTQQYYGPVGHIVSTKRIAERAAERLQQQIPSDTRNLTQRMFGDPVFERSSLYKKLQEKAGA